MTAADAWLNTGRPMHEYRAWLDNTEMPPALRKAYESEYAKKEAEITARVLAQNAEDASRWVETFDALTEQLDALSRDYYELRDRAASGRITAAQYDKELVRLDARRQALEARAAEPERDAERIARVAEAPVEVYDDLLAKYPALPRPDFSFTPFRPL